METVLDSSFVQIPFETVVERVDDGRLVLGGLVSLFQERLTLAEREVEFSTRAKRECLHEREMKQCSLEKALGYFKNYHLYNSKDQAHLRKCIDDEVLLPLNIVASKRAAEIATQRKHIHHEEQQYATAMDLLQKAKARHEKLIESIKNLHNKLSKRFAAEELAELEKKKGYFHGFFGSSDPEQEREKLKKKLEKLKQDFESSHRELMIKKNLVLESMINLDRAEENATEIYERLERLRVEKSAESLKKFCAFERQYLENRLKNLEQWETGAVQALNPVADADSFVERHKKPSEALRRSYAVHILHLNHLSRELPDDCFPEILEHEGSEVEEESDTEREEAAGVGGEDALNEGCKGPAASAVFLSSSPPTGPAPSEESPGVRSRSATASSAPLDSPPSPEMCIQERIVRRNLDAIFGAGAEDDGSDGQALSESGHGSECASSASTPPAHRAKRVEKDKGKKKRLSFRRKRSISRELVFTEEHSAAYLAVHPEEWRSLFADSEGRKYFLQMLDEKRSRSAMLHPRGFKALTTAMQVFLDECEFVKDRTSAMRMANMGNTFHSYSVVQDTETSPRATPVSNVAPIEQDTQTFPTENADSVNPFSNGDTDSVSSDNARSSVRKMYLQREKVIRDHSIWSSHRFWEDALQHGVIAHLKLTEAVVWDELPPEELHEAIIGVQNIIFGQLGAMAFTMHEIGLPREKVENTIADLCKTAQLSFDMRKALMRSTADTFLHEEEEEISIEKVSLPKAAVIPEPKGTHLPLVVHEGEEKDEHFVSENKETMDELWWAGENEAPSEESY